jgi:NTE family protein
VGIALGAGGARGFAHVGVLKLLEERGVPVDAYAGSSIGALVAALTASGVQSKQADRMLGHWLRSGRTGLLRPQLSRSSLVSGRGLSRLCGDLFGDTRFVDMTTPLAVGVSDLRSRRGAYLCQGSVARAIRASCSIPGFFPPVPLGTALLVDGAVTDPVPVSALGLLGADITIAVDLTILPADTHGLTDLPGGGSAGAELVGNARPNLLETYHASFSMAVADKARLAAASADIMIQPQFHVTSWRAFDAAIDHVRSGYDAAASVAEALRERIPWLEQ